MNTMEKLVDTMEQVRLLICDRDHRKASFFQLFPRLAGIAVIFLFYFFSVCVFAATSPKPTLLISDPNKPIYLSKDNVTFEISVPANPTTGFFWFLKTCDFQLLTPVSYTFIPPKEAIPGKGGVAIWTFQVKPTALHVPIVTKITLSYLRPWTTEGSSERTFTVLTHT